MESRLCHRRRRLHQDSGLMRPAWSTKRQIQILRGRRIQIRRPPPGTRSILCSPKQIAERLPGDFQCCWAHFQRHFLAMECGSRSASGFRFPRRELRIARALRCFAQRILDVPPNARSRLAIGCSWPSSGCYKIPIAHKEVLYRDGAALNATVDAVFA